MKNKLVIFGMIAVLNFAFAKAQRGARVGYINMEYILENVPEYQAASKQLDTKMQKWKVEIDQMANEIAKMKETLQNEKVLLTKELIEEKEEDISFKEKELAAYQEKRFGAQGDFLLQKQQLIQPVQDQVFNEVQKIGEQKKYDFLVDSSEMALLYSAERHDISDEVLRAIGRAGKKKTAEEKKEAESKPEPYLSVVEAEEKEEKEQAKEEKKEEIKKAISERQAAREERKRIIDSTRAAKAEAYKKRREEMIAERDRKRDSIKAVREAAKEKRQAEIEKRKEGDNETPSDKDY